MIFLFGDKRVIIIRCLEKAQKIGMTMNIEKCQFKDKELVYLGHKLTSKGIEADENKVRSIMGMPTPEDKKDIQRLLGLVNYVGKFIPNLSEVTAPLRLLLKKNESWCWEDEQKEAFRKIKELILSKTCLQFYDVTKAVTIQVDASKSGIGAVLLQDNKPVAYASKSFTATQKRYAPIEQEMLAVVFGCQRFHQYIYGKKVLVQSDHKPLESIMKKALHNAPPRLQRMMLSLQKYDFELVYLAGKENILADTLSRAHLADTSEEVPEEELVAQVHMVYDNANVTNPKMDEIKNETQKDDTLMKISKYITKGWPHNRKQIQFESDETKKYMIELTN